MWPIGAGGWLSIVTGRVIPPQPCHVMGWAGHNSQVLGPDGNAHLPMRATSLQQQQQQKQQQQQGLGLPAGFETVCGTQLHHAPVFVLASFVLSCFRGLQAEGAHCHPLVHNERLVSIRATWPSSHCCRM